MTMKFRVTVSTGKEYEIEVPRGGNFADALYLAGRQAAGENQEGWDEQGFVTSLWYQSEHGEWRSGDELIGK